jgi:hypothetical protein
VFASTSPAALRAEYPVSHRAITLELFGHGPQGLVDVAEQVELGLWPNFMASPKASRNDTFLQTNQFRKGNIDE